MGRKKEVIEVSLINEEFNELKESVESPEVAIPENVKGVDGISKWVDDQSNNIMEKKMKIKDVVMTKKNLSMELTDNNDWGSIKLSLDNCSSGPIASMGIWAGYDYDDGNWYPTEEQCRVLAKFFKKAAKRMEKHRLAQPCEAMPRDKND